MTAFVGKNVEPEIRRANFVVLLEWLGNLSRRQDAALQETCILALCNLARYVSD